MPKKKKLTTEVEEPVEETPEEAIEETPQTFEAPTPEEEIVEPIVYPTVAEPKPKDTVKVKVIIGTLQWEEGTFSKGDVFEATRERAERFSKTSVKILG